MSSSRNDHITIHDAHIKHETLAVNLADGAADLHLLARINRRLVADANVNANRCLLVGQVRLWLGDDQVAEGVVPEVATMISSIGMDVGRNISGVSHAYEAPFEFAGEIREIRIETVRALRKEDEQAAEIRVAMGTQ